MQKSSDGRRPDRPFWDKFQASLADDASPLPHVDIVPFDSVSDSFAATEGEGDKTLRYWRKLTGGTVPESVSASAGSPTDRCL